jgi:osmotically-inducible protein OsmY
MTTNHEPRHAAASALIACLALLTLGLTACNRNEDRSAGEVLDSAISTTERKADEAKQDMQKAGRDVKEAVGSATESAINTSRDITITAEVKTKLAADPGLSALAINVDTAAGRVVLRGSAPDTDARSRATDLARAVAGVSAVDNELTVQAKP